MRRSRKQRKNRQAARARKRAGLVVAERVARRMLGNEIRLFHQTFNIPKELIENSAWSAIGDSYSFDMTAYARYIDKIVTGQ